jgi:hypothetical protein
LVACPPQCPGELGASPELERRPGGDPVRGLALLARELVDPLVADHPEPVHGVEHQHGVSEREVVSSLIVGTQQHHGRGGGAGMLQVTPRMEAGDLLDGLGQGVDQAAGGVGGEGEQSGAELADEPGGAVATAGPGAVGGAEPIEHHG